MLSCPPGFGQMAVRRLDAESRMRLDNGRRSGVDVFELTFFDVSEDTVVADERDRKVKGRRDDPAVGFVDRCVRAGRSALTTMVSSATAVSQDHASPSWRPCHSSMVRPSITRASCSPAYVNNPANGASRSD